MYERLHHVHNLINWQRKSYAGCLAEGDFQTQQLLSSKIVHLL